MLENELETVALYSTEAMHTEYIKGCDKPQGNLWAASKKTAHVHIDVVIVCKL